MRELAIVFINLIFGIYFFIILARVFLPWFPTLRYHPISKPVLTLTDPVLSFIKKGLPPSTLGIDASPFIAIILLWVLQRIILLLIG